MAKEKWFIQESELDDIQYDIKNLKPEISYVVQGCAGSGKTVLALWRAKQLHESGNNNYYVIVYTKALRKFIDDGVRSIGIDSNKVLYHWQWQHVRGYRDADYIIVDESTDFTSTEVQKIQQKASKSVLFFGDSAQQLYTEKEININGSDVSEKCVSMNDIANITSLPIRNLNRNYRLPAKIARFSQHLNFKDDQLVEKCTKEGVSMPVIRKCLNREDEIQYILYQIKSKGLKDVAILLPTNLEVKAVYDLFVEQKINCEVKFRKKDSETDLFTLDFSTENPKIMTYHSSKGLQFESVFMPFCETIESNYLNPLYVATTRSYNQLVITYSNQLSPFISKIPKELYTEVDPKDISLTPF